MHIRKKGTSYHLKVNNSRANCQKKWMVNMLRLKYAAVLENAKNLQDLKRLVEVEILKQ